MPGPSDCRRFASAASPRPAPAELWYPRPMPSIFWRILAAVLVVLAVFALLGPVARVIGFPLSADVHTIIRVIVAIGAAWYILFGSRRPV